jgi:hypothetical protein
MQPRQILIVAIAALVAFGAAFGIAKAGGGDEPKASGAIEPAEVIDVGDATVSASVPDAGALPALRVPEKTPDPPDDGTPATITAPEPTVAPSTGSTAGSTDSSSGSTGSSTGSTGGSDPPVSTGGGD